MNSDKNLFFNIISRKVIWLACIWGVLATNVLAWDWPVKDPVLVADFASENSGSFLPGVFLKSSEALVRSVHSGELVFFSVGPRRDHRGFPGTPGGTLVIHHDSGIRSVYRGLQPDSVRDFATKVAALENKVRQNEIIGMMPIKPDTSPENLFFQLIDNHFGGAVNPMLILPRLVDDRPPAITATEIIPDGTSVRIPLKDRMELEPGKFQLFFQLRDSYGLKGNHLASVVGLPQEIRVILNGNLSYQSIKQSLGMNPSNPSELVLSRNPFGSFAVIYPADNMIYAGEFSLNDGTNRLEIRAIDLQGNRSSVSYRIIRPNKPLLP